MEMEKKNMLQNHSVEDKGAYLTLTLGDDEIVVTPKHLDTVNELCEYLDCLTLLITLVGGQNDCILQQGEKISSLENEKVELAHKIEAYKDANARLGEQVKHLKATVKSLEEYNDFNEECRKMHLDAVKKDLDEAVAEKKVLAAQIDELQNRISNKESLIKRLRAVAERNAKDGFETARNLVELKNSLCDIHDWIETVVDTQKGD